MFEEIAGDAGKRSLEDLRDLGLDDRRRGAGIGRVDRDDGLDGSRPAAKGLSAIERVARPHEIVMEASAEHQPVGGGEACAHARQLCSHPLEDGALLLVFCCGGLVGAGEVAHNEDEIEAAGERTFDSLFCQDPKGDAKTVIRGYTGIYFARSPLLLFAGPFNNFRNPPGDLSSSLPFSTTSLAAGNPFKSCTTVYCQMKLIGIDLNTFSLDALPDVGPDKIQAIAAALGLSFNPFFGAQPILMANDFHNPRSYQGGIGIERQFGRGLTLGADFTYNHTVYLQRNREINLPKPTLLAGDPALRPFYGLLGSGAARPAVLRPQSQLGSIQQRESSGKSLYRALTVRAKFQRGWGQFNAFYTYSKLLSDDDNERDAGGALYDDTFNLAPEYGLSRLDRKHQFVVNPVFFLKGGIDVSSAIRLRSGRPIDATLGFDANEDRLNNDRPYFGPGIPFTRNLFRNKPLYDYDVRVAKRLSIGENRKIILSADLFNIFNVPYLTTSSDDFRSLASPNFGLANAAGATRRIQMALRLTW